jgi:hypothetical protein
VVEAFADTRGAALFLKLEEMGLNLADGGAAQVGRKLWIDLGHHGFRTARTRLSGSSDLLFALQSVGDELLYFRAGERTTARVQEPSIEPTTLKTA